MNISATCDDSHAMTCSITFVSLNNGGALAAIVAQLPSKHGTPAFRTLTAAEERSNQMWHIASREAECKIAPFGLIALISVPVFTIARFGGRVSVDASIQSRGVRYTHATFGDAIRAQ